MLIRALLILSAIIILPWVFVSRLVSEIRSAFWFAWNDVMQNVDAFKRAWKAKSIKQEDWS